MAITVVLCTIQKNGATWAPMNLLDPIGMNPPVQWFGLQIGLGEKNTFFVASQRNRLHSDLHVLCFCWRLLKVVFDPYLYCSTYRTIVYPQNCMIPDPKMRPSLLWLQDATGMDPFGVHATRRRRSLFPLTVWNLCDLRGCAIHDPPGLYRCLANVRRTRQR